MTTKRPLAWLSMILVGCGSDGGDGAPEDGGSQDDSAVVADGGRDSVVVTDSRPDDANVDSTTPTDARTDVLADAGADTAKPPGTLLFVGDFETGDLKQWDYVDQCAAGRITVYTAATAPTGAPPPRQGTYAARFHVLDTDVTPCTSTDNPRAQIASAETLFSPGDEAWEAWSVWLPASFPKIECGGSCPNGAWFQFQEDYGAPYAGSPSIGWDIGLVGSANHFSMDRGEQYGHDRPWTSPLITARWVDFLVHKRFSNTLGGGGYVEAWVDKKPVTFAGGVTRLSMQTMHASQTQVGFFLNSYRAVGMFSVADTYYDGARVGTTREIVELP